ncbi:MAG: low temperature requirement protein A [Nitrososphaeraceae archaeon]
MKKSGGEERKEEKERRATWLELFYDLVFVAVVTQLAENLDHNISLIGLLSFVALYVPVWFAWIGATFFATRFGTDDLAHRILTLLQMMAAAAMAVNVSHGLGETSAGFALSYAAIRFILVIEYLRIRRNITLARPLTERYLIGFSSSAVIWTVSAFVPPPLRFVLWGIGLAIDFGTPFLAGRLAIKFAPHISHLPERMGLFVIIVLGESILGVVLGLAGHEWNIYSSMTVGLGLSIPFSLWWIYFDNIDGSAIRAATEKGKRGIYYVWLYIHFPLVVGLTAIGIGIKQAASSNQEIALPLPELWLICGSVSSCLFIQAILHLAAAAGDDSDTEHKTKMKWATYRIISGIIIIAIAILGLKLFPVVLMFILAFICALQIVLDLKDHPHHRVFRLW